MADFRHLTNLYHPYDDLDKKLIAALGDEGKIAKPQPTMSRSTEALIEDNIVGLYSTWVGLQQIKGATGWCMTLQDFNKLALYNETIDALDTQATPPV